MSPRLQPLTQREPATPLSRMKRVSEHGLRPRHNPQPPFRRARPEGGFISPLQAATTHLPQTYRICNPSFNYQSSRNPRRPLTKPSEGCKNDGHDNEHSDYILYVNDVLGLDEGHKYLILDVLGQGTFGQVVKCQNMKTLEVVAVKVIKNKTAYFNQSMMEVTILDLLNNKLDKSDEHHLLRLKDTFIHRHHLCLVFELLSVNLYELIKQNQFRGLSMNLVRVFATQLLDAMTVLNEAKIIHCDLKPENILLKNLENPNIKVIDFGSACHERQTVYTYIQSRFYRSPEVLLGLPYSAAIDTWSLGCIAAELFLGLPLFPGSSEYNQITRITEMLGHPPSWMLEMGKQSGEFFEKSMEVDAVGRKRYRLKTLEQYSIEHKVSEQPSKRYFQESSLHDIVMKYPLQRKNMTEQEISRETYLRGSFVDFVGGLLNMNPLERWSPQQARLHPFITGERFNGPFVPPAFRAARKPTADNPLPPPPSHHNQAPQQKAAEKLIASQAVAHEKAEAILAAKQQQQMSSNPPMAKLSSSPAMPNIPHQSPGNPYDPNPYLQPLPELSYPQQGISSTSVHQSPNNFAQYSPSGNLPYGQAYSTNPSTSSPYYAQQFPMQAQPHSQVHLQAQVHSQMQDQNVHQQSQQQQQQAQNFNQRRARAGTMGHIDMPVNLQRQTHMLNPALRSSPNYGSWQHSMDPASQNYMGPGQGSGDNRRGSIQAPNNESQIRDSQAYFSRWG
ncbi:putative Protein kinase Yak1 [Taphrina deformans PYCC 5710]|uniref:Protein kinase domain-containing protein n=1 Tax=Taphrina deformans (strain PYCC 5710 / ATCC 11124 / CBS 356.35 / IMI 108563 / JCM 9778 / NBRC 8474) TaxID=1097556 RepID=R4X896_TAPDE|nr:putative Protein kinase Yak1 [Taphrina deformans PYCC 5710]|eukprot:CCG81774.1 putative Protein kinase Yak1 [Taphrina deformans PYCC 5710]